MTMLRPNIEIRKLVVSANGRSVFSADFHKGLNILRGENSSGKSTIMDFLFYGLGGDLTEWREAALQCDEVTTEVLLNGMPATFKREVRDTRMQPMRIYEGPFAEADVSSSDGWKIYPYKRSSEKESFSQVLFRWLDLPQVPGHETSNITMHQLLRLIYSDQVTPIQRIFRLENTPFELPLVRQTVGNMLCGAYDRGMFEAQLRLRDAKKEFESYNSELRSIYSTLGTVAHSLTLDWVSEQRKNINTEMLEVQDEIVTLEEKIFNGEVSDGLSIQSQKEAYEAVVDAQTKLAETRSELDEIQFEIADSQHYIESLIEKRESLQDASLAANALGAVSFLYCPACFAPIESPDSEHHCSLCKAPFDRDKAQSRVLTLLNEVGLQLKQSETLQRYRKERVALLEKQLSEASTRWESINRRYKLINRVPSTELRTRARELHRRAGYLERELEDLNEKAALIGRLDDISRKKADVQAEISMLTDRISAGEKSSNRKVQSAYKAISENVKWLLKRDLARQDTFERANRIEFSFEGDWLSVNGESYFSASSMVYLRNSFFVGFWKASLEQESIRYPRFLLMDTIEDKGMEPARSHNFQNILAEISEASNTDHQLIYATSMISPKLADTDYVVGRYFTHDKRTLELS
ncbi:AAA family ATPase [Thalassospira profundimaris]|uniref:Rad50/SbcC-type AAA domain-containing protein n=1 Tax=Thalassospira profundimaris TaxID=502049 RepID=A0A367WVU3_9PROT|nr:AAA family ATPase [Thalassospira profundimaris]RCK45507.1 hypothetical protein TH30_13100 [Thalassospira profundimaris]